MATSIPRTKITVSRKWSHPTIEAYLHSDSVGARMNLDDFVTSLAGAIGNPAMIVTKAQLLAKMREAADKVSAEMKDATKFVV